MQKNRKKILENPDSFAAVTFDDIGKVFNGPKLIHITIAKCIFTVLYNMIFDCCESGCYMLR